MCHNTVGGFSCSCREGFVFGSDGVTCECKDIKSSDTTCLESSTFSSLKNTYFKYTTCHKLLIGL